MTRVSPEVFGSYFGNVPAYVGLVVWITLGRRSLGRRGGLVAGEELTDPV